MQFRDTPLLVREKVHAVLPCEAFDGGLGLQTPVDKLEDVVNCGRMCYIYSMASTSGSLGPSII